MWYVYVVYVCGMFMWYMYVVCLCGICIWYVYVACGTKDYRIRKFRNAEIIFFQQKN